MCGRPSSTLFTVRGAALPCGQVSRRCRRREEPEAELDEAASRLDEGRLVVVASPRRTPSRPAGSSVPAPSCDLAKARPKSRSMPITSPVDFISGPRISIDAGETREREHGLFHRDVLRLSELRGDFPRANACRAFRPPSPAPPVWRAERRWPCATNGTVREARGLTSSI